MGLLRDPYSNISVFRPEARTASEIRLMGWNIPPSELEHIPDHWLSYSEPPASIHYMLGALYMFLMVFSLVGNGLVIWIFSSAKSLRTASNIFVVNLAILDFIMLMKAPIFIYNSFQRGFSLGHVACQIFATIGSISGIGGGMTNAFIAYDRYNVITRPLEGKLSVPKAVIIVVFIWVYTIPWTVFPLTEVWGRFVPEIRLLGWNVPPNELVHIPDHWFSYPEPPMSVHYMLALIYTFFTIASLIGNGLVLWIFSSAKSLRTASNIFVVNLAFFDFVMMLKAPIFIYNSINRGFALGNLGCQVFGVMGAVSGIGAGMTNAFIAYDRYNVITRPLEGKLSIQKAILMTSIIWIYALPWSILPATRIWGRFVPEGYLTSCTFDYMTDNFDTKLFVGCIFVCSYVFPMTMIMYFYSQIVGHVFAHEKHLREQAKKMNVESLRSNVDKNKESAEIRIAKAAITICFLFVASWTPYGIMSLIGAFGDRNLLTPGVTMIPACCCKLVACIDPYVYAISHPRYRLELQKKLPWLNIDEKEDSASTQSTTTAQEVTVTSAT